jgi:hypothetical protein
VPFAYAGKPLPAAESPVRVVALPQLYTRNGIIPKKDILFTWTLNGETLMGGSQLGTDTTTITMPRYGNAEVVVTVETKDGSKIARGSLVLTPVKPRMLFYEVNSLYGTQMQSPARFSTSKEELTVRATPYYLNRDLLRNGALTYEWRVDGRAPEQDAASPLITLLRKNGGVQRADLTYSSVGSTLLIGQQRFSADFIDEALISL